MFEDCQDSTGSLPRMVAVRRLSEKKRHQHPERLTHVRKHRRMHVRSSCKHALAKGATHTRIQLHGLAYTSVRGGLGHRGGV